MKLALTMAACLLTAASFASAGQPAAVTKLSLGEFFTCALLDQHQVKCWGDGGSGQLGNGRTSPVGTRPDEMGANLAAVDLGADFEAVSLTAGRSHACALATTGRVKCWGGNREGELGLGDTADRGGTPGQMGDDLPYVDLGGASVREVVAQERHTCALFDDGQVKCWGVNSRGQLGLGDTGNRGGQPGQMGAKLPYLDLGTGVRAARLFVGRFHTCAVTTDKHVKCFGDGSEGAIGSQSSAEVGSAPGQMGDALGTVALGGKLQDFCATILSNCALTTDHAIRCFGYDDNVGRLGNGLARSWGFQPHSMGANIPLTVLGSKSPPAALYCGWRQSCGLLASGELKCWGANGQGQLGLGAVAAVGARRADMGDNLPVVDLGPGVEVKAVAFGGNHTCVLTATGRVKCFGDNRAGQLGLGDTANRGMRLSEMGGNLPYLTLF